VLFGMPAAGKSSLLGALSQAAQTQEHLLGGRLVDRSRGLAELQQRLYDESPRRTAEEIAPYAIDYEPIVPDGKAAAGEHLGAVVIDCDGRVANDLLVRRQTLDEDSPEGTLAHEVADADGLILMIDAAAPPAQVETDFAEFDRFLRAMERSRGRRTEVGGLPVFLVLSKCDLLAQPGDTAAAWMEHIEQRKRDVGARFRDLLARRAQEGTPAFGRIDLNVWATAVKRPALAGTPPRPRDPYGVAELFRQALAAAAAFHGQRQRSGRRLLWTVGVAGVLVLAMLGGSAGLLLYNRSTRTDALRQRIEDFRFLDRGSPAERLRGPVGEVRDKLERLQSIRDDPLFDALPAEQQDFVRGRLEELQSYLDYAERLRRAPRPESLRSEQALTDLQERLKKDLALPRPDWAGTEAGRLHLARLEDAEALRKAVARARNWHLDNVEQATRLWTLAGYTSAAGPDWPAWSAAVEKLLDPNRKPPFSPDDPLPGASSALTWATALRFDSVVDAKASGERDRQRLKGLLDLAAALGRVPATPERPPVLVIGPGFKLEQARGRVQQLQRSYPDYGKAFAPANVPDAARPAVRQAARASYAALLSSGRAEVLRQLQPGGVGQADTAERWEAVRAWLREPEQLASWRVLANLLVRLDDPDAEDPITALADFLGKREFLIDVRSLTLEVPERLGYRPRADAQLRVIHPGSKRNPALAFDPSGEPVRDARRRVRTYTYRLAEGRGIKFHPGEQLYAVLALTEGRALTWASARSALYPFERLLRPPRLQRETDRYLQAGTLQPGVRLTIHPDDGVPRVPDLMPDVQRAEE
jgi:hypothetical protein